MDAVVQASKPHTGFNAMAKATSIHQGYEGGDTQPMDTQVYRDWQVRESTAKTSAVTPKNTAATEMQGSTMHEGNTYDTNATDKTPRTYEEGDTGFMDLAGAFQPRSPAHYTSDLEDLLEETQRTEGHTQDNSRRTFPQTPALAGQKRKANGDTMTSQSQPTTATKTPGFTQMFGAAGNAPAFTVSQLIDQTQEPSSPARNACRSDPVDTRPSPNMKDPYSVSSPEIAVSSPVEALPRRPMSTGGEPKDTYTSMRESQERRAARLRQELEAMKRQGAGIDDGGDLAENSDERRLEKRRMHRILSDRSLPDLARFGAPTRADSRPASNRKRPATVDLVTPATTRKDDRLDFDVSDHGDVTEDEGQEEAEEEEPTTGEDENAPAEEEVDVDPNDNDEYDELAQRVLKSQGGEVENVDYQEFASEHNEMDEHGDVDEAGDDTMHEMDETVGSDGEDLAEEPPNTNARSAEQIDGTQPSAIADSQPQPQPQPYQPQTAASSQRQMPSSAYSFVPGSQHAGKTSQDSVRAVSKVPDSSNMPNGATLSQPQTFGAIPSSPPRAQANDTVPDNSIGAPLACQQALARFQERTQSPRGEDETLHEIPESDFPEGGGDQGDGNIQGDQPPPYYTAQSHPSAAGRSPKKPAKLPAKIFASQQSKAASPSPRKAAGVSRFMDIADDPAPDGSGEASLDLDAMMGDVFTAEDREVVDAISSPSSVRTSKRRKTSKNKSVRVSPTKAANKSAPMEALQEDEDSALEGDMAGEASKPFAKPSRPLVFSPSKANVRPTGAAEDVGMTDATPSIVRHHEAEGARAASQLVEARSKKTGKVKTYARNKKAASNAQAEASAPARQEKASRLKTKSPREHHSIVQNEASEQPQISERKDTEKVVQDASTDNGGVRGDGASTKTTNPHRVFALFKGQYNSFYPATWLASSADAQEYRVRFDDTTITSIASHLVGRLELRQGDVVKVDLPGMKKNTYVVQGLSASKEATDARPGEVDIFGNSNVKVQVKASTRNSFAADGATVAVQGEVLDVHLSCVYLTHTMWANYSARIFTPPVKTLDRSARLATPSTGTATPSTETPISRSRRNWLSSARITTGKAPHPHPREGSMASSTDPSNSDVFTGMAFAISYGSNEAEKALVTDRIQRNGGIILESGFDELFTLPNLETSNPTSPNKRSPRKETTATIASEGTGLRLKPEYADLGFVALVADRHSRRAKYMQALALGLPTIAGRWVTDSLQNTTGPLPWTKYLLPAGDSSFLGGAVRSRTLASNDPATARLGASIENREILLQGQGVLIVSLSAKKGKGANMWERRKAYAFLTLALGAGSVKRVKDVEEAKALVGQDREGRWKWVYVDGGVEEAAGVLFSGNRMVGGGGSKKRKRESGGGKREFKMSVGDGRVRVVNDEFVVQSLILGALVD